MPNDDLGGITPAEAVQYKSYATGAGSSWRTKRIAAARRPVSTGWRLS